MRTISKSYYISAFKKDLSAAVNTDRHFELRIKLQKLGYSPIAGIGCCDGIPELSFLVSSVNTDTERDIIILAKEYNQESVLCVYGIDAVAELIFVNNNDPNWDIVADRKIIGKMKCLGPDEGSIRGRDYSYFDVGNGNNFYVVE